MSRGQREFIISDSGYLYEYGQRSTSRNRRSVDNEPKLLGHISSLLNQETCLGKEVRCWWKAYLESIGHREVRPASSSLAA
jgi:hypothetical protein